MGIANSPSSFSVKCLLWQYDELVRKPLEGVNAAPLEHNVFEWHGNFYWPEDHKDYPGMVVHFILTLPRNFPNGIPNMELLTSFDHSHVFGGSICFSLLQEFQWFFRGDEFPDTCHWNPSRTIRSLLESVYVFLTVDEDGHVCVTKESTKRGLASARRGRCTECGHNPSAGRFWPPEDLWMAAKPNMAPSKNDETEQMVCSLAMHEDLASKTNAQGRPLVKLADFQSKFAVTEISSKVMDGETRKVAKTRKVATGFEDRSALMKAEADELVSISHSLSGDVELSRDAREDFRCSVSGVSFDHSNTVILGFGVNVVRRQRDNSIESISTDLCPISMEIFFKGNIRKSALGAPMTHFFPFALNEVHWKKAKRVLPGCINAILKGGPEHTAVNTPEDRLLFVVGELWKSMAVLMMKGSTHASEKVLKGFCAFHHILLMSTEQSDPLLDRKSLAQVPMATAAGDNTSSGESWVTVVKKSRPAAAARKQQSQETGLLALSNRRVIQFARNPKMRHKSQCPDYGRFLPQILLSNISWQEVRKPFIGELLTRNARWVCKSNRRLSTVRHWEWEKLGQRAVQSWDASSTGLKLTAFQVRFLLNTVPWAHLALPEDIAVAYARTGKRHLLVRAMYNRLGGRPTAEMLGKFQNETKRIESLSDYKSFFRTIDMPQGEMEIQKMLCEAMNNSKRCGYHY